MISPQWSFWAGLLASSLFGLLFGYLAYLGLNFWHPLGIAAGIGLGGFMAKSLFETGYDQLQVPVGHLGVKVFLGDHITGGLYASGDHWVLPYIYGGIVVDVRQQRIDLDNTIFSAPARDTTDIDVDGFMLGHVDDAIRSLQSIEDLRGSMLEELEAKIRFFASMVTSAKNATGFKDLVAEYLGLDPQAPDFQARRQALKLNLERLVPDGYIAGGNDGVAALMEHAGSLATILHSWGVALDEVEIEKFDVVQEIKAANTKRALEQARMDALRTDNKAKVEMIKELVDTGTHPDKALNSVDMMLNLPVQKVVNEISIDDLAKTAAAIGEGIAKAIRRA